MKHTITKLALGLSLVSIPLISHSGSWTTENIAGMPVHIYTPTSTPLLNNKRALMVTTGGCGQQAATNTDFRDQSNWEVTADQYGMVVAVPNAPNGGVGIFGCWDYYNTNHTVNNRHNDNILSLVATLQNRSALNIDVDQVYMSGLSSGGGIVNVMACLAPDVFAGLGNSAGPTIGTADTEAGIVGTTVQQAVSDCMALAGSNSQYFDTQIMSIVWGTNDFIAAQGYADINADSFASLYGANKDSGSDVITGISLDGVEESYSDNSGQRIQNITINGLGHAWPAGGGSGLSAFIDNTSINYPAVLTAFLFENNRRVNQEPPVAQNSFNLNAPLTVNLNECDLYSDPGFIASDASLGDISDQVIVTGNDFDTCVSGSYTVNYSVTFSDGSEQSAQRLIEVSSVPEFTCVEYVSSNFGHIFAGRAFYCLGGAYACAVGSQDVLGFAIAWPLNVVLSETTPDFYQAGACP
jgi:poly(3-hydroxybutyrate) depolymerase